MMRKTTNEAGNANDPGNMLEEMNRRITILEEKFAYQEKIIDDLNDVILDQQTRLDWLKEQLDKLRGLLITGQQPPFGENDPPPPHY